MRRTEAEGVAGAMIEALQQTCDRTPAVVDLLPPRLLASDVVARVAETQPTLLCLGAVVPGGGRPGEGPPLT